MYTPLPMQQKAFAKHANCEIYADVNPKNKQGQAITTHAAGLYCKNHGTWLKWLSLAELNQLTGLVEVRDDFV